MYGRGNSGWTISMRNEEFQEDDVWAVNFKDKNDIDSFSRVGNDHTSKFTNVSPRPLPSAARMIPRPGINNNINTSALEQKIVQQSAPVNVPDWSKIYGKQHSKTPSSAWLDHDHDHDHDDGNGYDDDDDEDGMDDGDGRMMMMMPPHEWIAKKLARNQISSFSVCEGVGRTLKGRDLSRVRNAVLTRTGFLE